MDEFITIGKITKPHGVKGEVIIRNESRWYEPFSNLTKVLAETGSKKTYLEIETIRHFNDKIAVKFKGIDNPEDAAKYRNMELKISKNKMPELQDEEYYGFEIRGFKVFDLYDNCHGEVIDIVNLPANDVLVVKMEDEKEILIPAVKTVIKKIDTAGKKVVVESIEDFQN